MIAGIAVAVLQPVLFTDFFIGRFGSFGGRTLRTYPGTKPDVLRDEVRPSVEAGPRAS